MNSHSVCVRFAPSPTGFLHLGNARIALFNWLFARASHGTFILRIDDTDQERSQGAYTDAVKKDLTWLGIDWDISFAQSERGSFYAPYIKSLKAAGHLYPCYETAQELASNRASLKEAHRAPVFDRHHRLIDTHRPVHWRFALEPRVEAWDDLLQGPCQYDTSHVSDPIVIREDGTLSYLLTSVLDDQDPDQPVSHIIRGLDHYVNTAIQRQMFHALQRPLPVFAHLPLIQHITGEKFSKRTGGHAIQDWRKEGVLPIDICQVLIDLSCSQPHLHHRLCDFLPEFRWDHYAKTAEVRLDPESITSMSAKHLAMMSWDDVQAYITDVDYVNAKVWDVIRENVHNLQEIYVWNAVLDSNWRLESFNDSMEVFSNAEFLQAAYEVWKLGETEGGPNNTTEAERWKAWSQTLIQRFQVKPPMVYKALRWVLTGRLHGPAMPSILSVLTSCEVEARLTYAVRLGQALFSKESI